MKKFLITFFSILILVLTPIGGFFIYGECIAKDVYSETYYAELKDKVDRLESRKDKKIVFIGGSSLIFGLRSEEIERATGYNVVDFGLYASLGTPIMMRLAEPYIKEGDIVILAPEINSQTYSDFMNYDVALRCFENMDYPLSTFSIDENMSYFFHYFKFQIEKGNANIELEAPYDKASFNDYCDIDNEIVENNILVDYYDPTQMVEPSKDILEEVFTKRVNEFNKSITKKKASLYFSFSPTNALALKEEGLDEFNKALEDKLDCKILGSVKEFTYHQYYFYDTNFHLNRSGSYLHSKTMSDLIKKEFDIDNEYEIEVPIMPLPKYQKSHVKDVVEGLIFEQVIDHGSLTYVLDGVSDELKGATEIYVKDSYNGIPVTGINNQPFKDMPNLTKVTLAKEIMSLMNPLFDNCPNVTGLYLEQQKAPSVCFTGLVDGASPDCKIYIQRKYYTKFINDYSWLAYRSLFKRY